MSGIRISVEPWSFSVSLGRWLSSEQTLACAHMCEEAGMEMVNSCLCLYRANPGINFLLFHFPSQNLGHHFLILVFDSFWPEAILGLNFWLALTLGCFGWLASLPEGEWSTHTPIHFVCEHPQCSLCTSSSSLSPWAILAFQRHQKVIPSPWKRGVIASLAMLLFSRTFRICHKVLGRKNRVFLLQHEVRNPHGDI